MLGRLAVSFLLAGCLAGAAYAATEVKYCIPYDVDESYVSGCTDVFSQANNDDVEFSCVSGGSAYGCMKHINEGTAHLTTADGGKTYLGYHQYQLLPLLSENYGAVVGGEYYGVAVVHKDMCEADGEMTLSKLQGKEACATGYKRSVGWMMPIGTLISSNVMERVNEVPQESDDAESAAAFFSKICAQQSGNGPLVGEDGTMQTDPKLCTLCKDDCSENDGYAGYGGALKCLTEEETAGSRVAFVKHSTVTDFAEGGKLAESWAANFKTEDLRLVCPAGGCMEVDQYAQCNFGLVPAHVLLAAGSLNKGGENEALGKSVQDAIVNASKSEDWMEATKNFRGDSLIIFAKDTESVDAVSVEKITEFVDEAALSNYEEVFSLMRPARFCVYNDDDLQNCNTVVSALREYNSTFQWGCVKVDSKMECFKAIANENAELMVMDGAVIYEANELYDLTPIAAEYYDNSGVEGTSYYAVAVVAKEWCDSKSNASFADLRGADSCHTGYGRGAGWKMPLGALASEGLIEPIDVLPGVAADVEAMDNYFGKMCANGLQASGPVVDENGVATYHAPLCAICQNTTNGECYGNDTYADYVGAFRCLLEEAGQVAFTKHSVPLTYAADGEAPEYWGTKNKDDFRLLCKNGGCAPLDDFQECHLAQTPAHAIIANPGYLFFKELQSTLVAASNDKDIATKMFAPEDFWGQATNSLTPVDESAEDYLGETYAVYEALYRNGWVTLPPTTSSKSVKYCIPYPANASVVEQCSDVLRQANNETAGVMFECMAGGSSGACMQMIANKTADLTTLDGGDQYTGISQYDLVPIVAESYADLPVSYYAVAVVKADFCTDGVTLSSLQDQNVCHTGYGKTAGWKMPVGYMVRNNIVTKPETLVTGVQPDAQALAAFAGDVCAPRVTSNGPKVSSNGTAELWDELCVQCADDCTTEDRYYDYSGALRCMMEGKGAVAFVKHTTPLDYASDGPDAQDWSNAAMEDLRLLCPAGGCKALDEYADCALAKVPAHAIVGRQEYVAGPAAAALVDAGISQEWLDQAITIGDLSNTIFKKGTVGLSMVVDYEAFFGEEALANMQALDEINKPTVKFCTHSEAENTFCEENVGVLNAAQNKAEFTCVYSEDCVAAVAKGDADLVMLDSHDAWKATQSGLQVVAAENYRPSSKEYYAVAVTTKEFCEANPGAGLNKETLMNKNVCHTGYQRSAGWVVPVGYMLFYDILSYVAKNATLKNDAESVAAFFNKVCAGRVANNGPVATEDGEGALWDELCGACGSPKDSAEYCTVDDIYYNYEGSVRGVMEGACDLAFTKHETALAYVKGAEGAPEWATMTADEMRLLCPNSGCNTIDAYATCSLAAVPAHSALIRAKDTKKNAIQAALDALDEDADVQSTFFSTAGNPEDYLFKSSTSELNRVEDSSAFFGNIEAAFKGFDDGLFNEERGTSTAGRKL